MRKAIDYAKYFIKNDIDSFPNTYDGNMKLQKMLLFANLVNLAENGEVLFDDDILAFKNGCVVEDIRLEYKNNYQKLIDESLNFNLTFMPQNLETLNLSAKIFGSLSAKELSDLNHQFDFWRNGFKKSRDKQRYNKAKSIINIDDMKKESFKIRKVIDNFKENLQHDESFEVVNGVKFFYDPKKINITDEILIELENFSLSELAEYETYNIYLKDGELVIF